MPTNLESRWNISTYKSELSRRVSPQARERPRSAGTTGLASLGSGSGQLRQLRFCITVFRAEIPAPPLPQRGFGTERFPSATDTLAVWSTEKPATRPRICREGQSRWEQELQRAMHHLAPGRACTAPSFLHSRSPPSLIFSFVCATRLKTLTAEAHTARRRTLDVHRRLLQQRRWQLRDQRLDLLPFFPPFALFSVLPHPAVTPVGKDTVTSGWEASPALQEFLPYVLS